MKKLLLITGDLATGKSTFAAMLSHRYGTLVIYKDKIKEVLGDTIGFKNRKENLKLSRATMELMIHSFSEIASLGKDLILEANFKEAEMKRLHEIAKANGYDLLTLVTRADMEIIYKRFINRIENENRHPVHLSGFDDFESFEHYINMGRREKIFGDAIKVCANDFSYQNDSNLLTKIDIFMDKL